MRRARWISVAVVAVVVLTAAAPPPSDVLLDEIGAGWQPVSDCPNAADQAGSASRCFAYDDGANRVTLAITATPVAEFDDPRNYASVLASGLAAGGVELPTPGLTDVFARVEVGFPHTIYVVTIAAERHVITLLAIAAEPHAPGLDTFLLSVAERQQDAAGGPPPPPEPAPQGAEAELDRLLFEPAPGSGLAVISTSSSRLRYDDLVPPSNDRLRRLLNRGLLRFRLMQADDGSLVAVALSRQPYDIFAATQLGATGRTATTGRVEIPGLEDLGGAVAYRVDDQPPSGVIIGLRRGRYLADVHVQAPAGTPRERVEQLALDVASEQAALLPPGGTGEYTFPPLATAVGVALAVTTGAGLAALGLSRGLAPAPPWWRHRPGAADPRSCRRARSLT